MKKVISILIVIIIMFALMSCANTQKPDWQEHLDLGQKYLLDGNYEQAIVEFNKVIEIEPKNVDAYLGLAEAYAAQGDYDSAISVLEQGYAETGNQSLQDKINELRGLTASQTEAVTAQPEITNGPTTTLEVIENQEVESQMIKQVSLGYSTSAAITVDGSLYTWGLNNCGQLGDNTAEFSSRAPIKIMDNVSTVSLGYLRSAAITTDGSLYMWGENICGQLGNGTSGGDWDSYDEGIDSSVPIKIMDNVVYVSLGYCNSAAITADGSLYMWGENIEGQLGNGTSGGYMYSYDEGIDSNVPIKIMDNVASVSLGGYHNAAITTDGSLYTWGSSVLGAEDSYVPVKIMDNVVSVSLGQGHSAAITSDGCLYMWGVNNTEGQLGNATTEYSYIPIKIMDNVVSVNLGNDYSAAITTDGSLYMWGVNTEGQLGNGTTENSYVPIKIMDNVASVSLGFDHSAAITTDGSLYMWGNNQLGQLGNGATESSNAPIKIEIPTE